MALGTRNYGSWGKKLRIKGHEITVRLQQLIVEIASINSSKNSHVWEIFFLRVENNFSHLDMSALPRCTLPRCNKDYPTSLSR